MQSPLYLLRDDPQLFVAFVIAIVVAITVHEFSHAAAASNFLLALLSALALRLSHPQGIDVFEANSSFTVKLLLRFVQLNVLLGVFNLLPIPPLDGSRLLSILLPPSRQGIVYFLDQYGIFLLIGLLFLAPGLLAPVFTQLEDLVLRLVGVRFVGL